MRTLITTALVFCLVPTLALAQPAHRQKGPLKKLKVAIEKIERVEKQLGSKKPNGKKARQLEQELKEARLLIKEYMLDVREERHEGTVELAVNVNHHVAEGIPEPIPEEPIYEPMAPGAFAKVVTAVKQQGFSDEKLTVLSSAVRENYFTVAQVKDLILLFSFPDDKLKALRLLKNHIADTNNIFEIYSSFVHSSDKDAARKILEH